MQLFGSALALDLGTANTRLWARDQAPMVREASAVAYLRARSRVVAVGSEAREMARRQAENVDVVDPIARGTVASYSATVTMMRTFLRRAMPSRPVFSPTALVSAPAETTGVEYRALRDVLRAAGISRVYSVPKSLAACIGAGLPLDHPESVLVIDLGAGVSEIAVVALGMASVTSSMALGGLDIDEAIRRYLWRALGLRLSRASAEDVKLRVGSADPATTDETLDLSALAAPGADLKVSGRELAGVIQDRLEPLVDEVQWLLGQLTPKQQSEIQAKGGVLTGGGALLRGLPEMLSARLGIKVVAAEDPLSATVLGLSALVSDIQNRAFDEARLLRMGVQGFRG